MSSTSLTYCRIWCSLYVGGGGIAFLEEDNIVPLFEDSAGLDHEHDDHADTGPILAGEDQVDYEEHDVLDYHWGIWK